MRTLVLAAIFVAGVLIIPVQSQVFPFQPSSPTNSEQCRTFSSDVEKYASAYSKQHDECLDRNKADRKTDMQLGVCSRAACQILHDVVYSQYTATSVPTLRKQVEECFKQARQHEEEEAKRKREADDAQRRQQEDARTQSQKAEASQRRSTQAEAQTQNPPVLPKDQASAAHTYSVDSLKVNETKAQEQARLAARERERKERSEQAINEMADPFAQSGRSGSSKKVPASDGMVDPFAGSAEGTAAKDSGNNGLAEPFANADSSQSQARSDNDIAVEKGKDIAKDEVSKFIEAKADEARDKLDGLLEKARSKLSPSDFKVYQAEVQEAEAYLKGLSRVLKAAPFIADAWKASNNLKEGWNDFEKDCEQKGFEYVLKRLAPSFFTRIYEGPVGLAGSIVFESSSTQTKEQDFTPMNVINDPSHYSFNQRVQALQELYVKVGNHPEIWRNSNMQWLQDLTLRVYNSPDNPNIRLAPQGNNSDIQITPP